MMLKRGKVWFLLLLTVATFLGCSSADKTKLPPTLPPLRDVVEFQGLQVLGNAKAGLISVIVNTKQGVTRHQLISALRELPFRAELAPDNPDGPNPLQDYGLFMIVCPISHFSELEQLEILEGASPNVLLLKMGGD